MRLPADIAVRVLQADAVEHVADVLVLKHAQQVYGLDRHVVNRLGPRVPSPLPGVGEHALVAGPPDVVARMLLFIGVPELIRFGYHDMREFGRRALSVPAAERLRAGEISLTLHGAGFGLDEAEAFRAELAGMLEAIEGGLVERELRTITFVEWERRRAELLGRLLEVSWPGQVCQPAGGARMRSAGADSAQRPHAFVAMPFDETFEDRFHYGIEPQVHNAGLLCERMDQSIYVGDVVEVMRRRIASAAFVVADLSAGNPNVYLEVGYAWASGVPTILLCDEATEPHFDVRGHRYLRFGSIRDLDRKLARELDGLLSRAVEPGRAR